MHEKEKQVLFRMLQYSLFEESISDQNEMNQEALFEYEWFENYFTDDDREAYFIREEETQLWKSWSKFVISDKLRPKVFWRSFRKRKTDI